MNKSIALTYNTGRYLYNLRSELMQELQRRGYQVIAIAPRDAATPELQELGVRCVHYPISSHGVNPVQDLGTYWALRKALKAESPKIVFNFTIKPVIYGSMAAHALGIKRNYSMVPGLGYVFGSGAFGRALLRWFVLQQYRLAMKYNERVFFQNEHDRNFFIEHGLIDESKSIVVKGSGVDTSKFCPTQSKVQPHSFLMISRLYWEKGVQEFVDAAAILKTKYPDAVFQILGPLENGPSSVPMSRIKDWQKEGIVDYLGAVSDVRPFLSKAAVFVLPSYYREGVPKSILEALAMAKPVITTDWPGCRDTVEQGKNGFLVPMKDAKALANRMERFLESPSLVKQMGDHSRHIATTQFGVHDVNRIILSELLAA